MSHEGRGRSFWLRVIRLGAQVSRLMERPVLAEGAKHLHGCHHMGVGDDATVARIIQMLLAHLHHYDPACRFLNTSKEAFGKRLEPTVANRSELYKYNKLKLGFFAAACSSGRAATKVPERWKATWDDNLTLAQSTDAAGIDFLLPIARWKGYRGETNFHGAMLEATMWACGLLAQTNRITIFSPIHARLFHPVVAAKQIARADLVGHGRVAMNVVCGWNQDEFDMFAIENREHDQRYAYAREWLQVIRKLWSEDGEVDYEGGFIKLKSLISNPKPYGGARPLIMDQRPCASATSGVMAAIR